MPLEDLLDLIERARLACIAYRNTPVSPRDPKSAALHQFTEASIEARAAVQTFINQPLLDDQKKAA